MAPLLIACAMSAGARASAVRACIMALLFLGAPLVGRQADSLSALAVAAVLILAVVPSYIVDVGFIYSFTVVAGLLILYPPIDKVIRAWLAPDPFIPLSQVSRWETRWRSVAKYFASLFALSCAAWLASAENS